jgi:uncharacterized protein (DUF362 family)
MSDKKWSPITHTQEWFERTLSRRSFLKSQAVGALALAAGSSGLFLPGRSMAQEIPDIAVAQGDPAKAVRAAVKLMGGMDQFVKPGQKVLIKPNMSFTNKPEMATTTNPDLVRELVIMCREAGAGSVVVADYPLASSDACLANSGILDACKSIEGTKVIGATSDALYKEMDIPDYASLKSNGFLKDALTADVLIAVPIAKTHAATGVSLAMKGMMGLVYDRRAMHQLDLSASIVDICSILKPDLTIIDAYRVLSTNGPGGPGKILDAKTVIASRDMVAADAYATSSFEWYGNKYQPKQVQYIRQGSERGLGRMDIENMTIKEVTV